MNHVVTKLLFDGYWHVFTNGQSVAKFWRRRTAVRFCQDYRDYINGCRGSKPWSGSDLYQDLDLFGSNVSGNLQSLLNRERRNNV